MEVKQQIFYLIFSSFVAILLTLFRAACSWTIDILVCGLKKWIYYVKHLCYAILDIIRILSAYLEVQ